MLTRAFESAIRDSVIWAWNNAAGKPYEPDFIAALVVRATPALCNALKAAVAGQGIALSMASVFCHNKPMVKFQGKICELGDVLFVHRHSSVNGETTNQSLLLQAKMTNRQVVTIASKGDLVQLSLYTDWPEFEYVRSVSLNGIKRDIVPKTPQAGAQYLLVDGRGPTDPRSGMQGLRGTHCMGVWPAEQVLVSSETLATALIDVILGLNGRRFLDHHLHDGSGWSDMIWDLLKYAAGTSFRRGRIFRNPQDRAAGDTFFWSSELDVDSGSDPRQTISRMLLGIHGGADVPLAELPADEEGPGVSVILIDTIEHDDIEQQ